MTRSCLTSGNVTLFLKRAWKEYIQEDYELYLESRPDIMEQIKVLTETRIRQMQGQRTNQYVLFICDVML